MPSCDVPRALILAVTLALQVASAPLAASAQGPRAKYGRDAVRLYHRRTHLQQTAAPDYWALAPYYAPQRGGASCGLASAAMVLNALRAGENLPADEELITEERLLVDLGEERWRVKTSPDGAGLTLDELAEIITAAARHYQLGNIAVQAIHLDTADAAAHAAFRLRLVANEVSERDFIIVNFLQSRLTGDPAGAVGHFAPLAAYDDRQQAALLLDPDRDWYEPYWSPLTALTEAMATRDKEAGNMRGYVQISRK